MAVGRGLVMDEGCFDVIGLSTLLPCNLQKNCFSSSILMATTGSVSKTFAPAQDAPLSERDLDWAVVQRVQAGNVGAFDQLVQKYREHIFSVVYNMTSNREDASDLTQETFIKAFQAIGRFKGKSSFFTWIYRIAINTTMTFLKKRSRRRYISYENINEEVSTTEIFENLTAKTRTEKGALVQELQEKLNDSLQKLSPKHRTVVVLHEIEGLGHAEIAEITKTSVGTVRSRLHYAKQQLQSYLKDYLA
ncbi:RNA polymerase sigma factor RpoE [Lentimonas sp. CC19]|nr:RNA polymerase sigma factor RpoE [Lentimonas sp. CC10]CAA6694301.1 RNA polymerase sigma factor RpoE [Lentimonas sp. CC19]CAA7071073.1 RNA polymerase sigma factor RpoE [Lentimonas sp. CC11]